MRNTTRENRGTSREKTSESNMSQLTRASRFFVLALLLIASSPGFALAGNDVVVDGETKSFDSDDVIDNLTVINGGRALLNGTTVEGNLTIEGEGSYANFEWAVSVGGNAIVKDNGRLSMWYSTIGGDLQGDGCGHINFLISEVVGSLKMKGGADFNGAFGPCKVGGDVVIQTGAGVLLNWFTVGGKLHVLDNSGNSYIWIKYCDIGNDLKVCKNDMGQYITIENNTVAGNLEVKDNSPTPTVTGNEVEGEVKVE